VQVVADPAEAFEVLVHEGLGLAGRDPQLAGQPEGRQAVGQAVGHRLDLAAHLRGHIGRLDPEHPRPDEAVQVLPRAEGLDEPVVAGQVRHDPHLDLAVVRRHERLEPGPTTNISRIRPPSSVRIGTFCRLGSVEESRPVAAIVCR
jgi:hypothetical protein